MNTAQAQAKINALQQLIGHEKTSAAEKAAATRALARVRKALATAEPARQATWEPWFKGARYEDTSSIYATSGLTALIRADLKVAVKIARAAAAPGAVAAAGDAFATMPGSIRFSVTTPHHGSVRIKITGIPQDWGYAEQWSDLYRENLTLPSPALTALFRAVEEIANAYNFDDSDWANDYSHKRFYLDVTD